MSKGRTQKPGTLAITVERYAKNNAYVFKGKVTKLRSGKTGRPSVMTEEVVRKLEYAFAYDCTVEEACLYAGISRNTYYEFLKQYPDFQDRTSELRLVPVLMARMRVIMEAERNADMALKYLERRRKAEFSTRTEVAHSGDIPNRHEISPKTLALINAAFGNFAKKRAEKITNPRKEEVSAE